VWKWGAEWKDTGNFTVGVVGKELTVTSSGNYTTGNNIYWGYIPSVSFSNGNATINFSSITEIEYW
jgi:hypothetical protein